VTSRFFTIVNPAAGGGRCGKLATAALDRLHHAGLQMEITRTNRADHGTDLAREAYAAGYRNFLAVGGDGTSYEIVNGIFPRPSSDDRVSLGFLPLGTGNSFLKDFTSGGSAAAIDAIIAGNRRATDVLRLSHASGEIYFINLMTLGFAADANMIANERFKPLGTLGYLLSVLVCLSQLKGQIFPLRVADAMEWDRRPCLFLAFANSRFTGGKMLIAPNASTSDGLIEYVRWSAIGRLRLLRQFPGLFTGSHISSPLASRTPAREIEFAVDAPCNVSIDGECLSLQCKKIDVLPGSLDVLI
jgi:diacylglycerol kinase (ATP)